jgi:hypothetical protein
LSSFGGFSGSGWRGSTITLSVRDTAAARFPFSRGWVGALPQARSSKVRAADSRAPAGASAWLMISTSTSIAVVLCARASALMSSGIFVSTVIMKNQMAVFLERINRAATWR